MVEDKGLSRDAADAIRDMIAMCDVKAPDGSYRRQDPWQLLEALTAPGSPLADHPDSKVSTHLLERSLHSVQRSIAAVRTTTTAMAPGSPLAHRSASKVSVAVKTRFSTRRCR